MWLLTIFYKLFVIAASTRDICVFVKHLWHETGKSIVTFESEISYSVNCKHAYLFNLLHPNVGLFNYIYYYIKLSIIIKPITMNITCVQLIENYTICVQLCNVLQIKAVP